MSPGYRHDDYVLSFGWRNSRYRIGDVVIVQHPRYRRIIKRIVEFNTAGEILLAGDNPASTDSQSLGWLPLSCVLGKVIWHIPLRRSPPEHTEAP